MKALISGALAAATLAGATVAAPAAAQAQPWGWHGGYHRGYGSGALVGAGLLGLAAGVAIADRPRYAAPAYYPAYPAYGYGYAPPPPPVYYGGCGTSWRYDPYLGYRVPVRRCW